MKFFTDNTVENSNLLIKIKDYCNLNDFSRWKEILIDPHVYELTKDSEYSWINEINIAKFLDSLPENHYLSVDYPCDMNERYTELFLEKSWKNALKYHSHPQYIITVQSRFRNYWNFVEWFDKYNSLDIKSGILALGNMCRFSFLNNYLKHTLDYAFSHCIHQRIHIYGLNLRSIPYACKLSKKFEIQLSTYSTKWTRINAKYKSIVKKVACSSQKERQTFFNFYLKRMKELGVELENGV